MENMKKILFALLLIWGVAHAQLVPGYTYINGRYNYYGLAASNVFHVPAGATASLPAGAWVRSGALYYDSTGTDSGLYVYHRPYWVKVGQIYTAGNAMTLTGSAFDWGGSMTASAIISGHGTRSTTFDSTNRFRVTRSNVIRLDISNLLTGIYSTSGNSAVVMSGSDLIDLVSANTDIRASDSTRIFNGALNTGSDFVIAKSYVRLNPYGGQFRIDTLLRSSSSGDSVMVRETSTGLIKTRSQADVASAYAPGLQGVISQNPVLTSAAYNNIDVNTGSLQIGESAGLAAGKGVLIDMANDNIGILRSSGAYVMQVKTGGALEGQIQLQNANNTGLKVNVGDSIIIGKIVAYDKVRVKVTPDSLLFKNLPSGIIDTTTYKPIGRKGTYGDIVAMNSWAQVSGGAGSSTWNAITNPTGTQTLSFDDAELTDWTNGSNTETFHTYTSNSQTTGTTLKLQSSSATTGKMVDITMTGTAADNGQVGLNVNLSGVNASASKATYAGRFTNSHGGTTPLNWNVYTDAGNAGFGTPAATDANATVIIRQPNDGAADRGIKILSNNELASMTIGYAKMKYTGQLLIEGNGGMQLLGNASAVYFNMTGAGLTTLGGSATPTSTTQLAGSYATTYRAITALRTLDISDQLIEVTANTFTVTLPTAVGITGRTYTITNSGTGVTTVGTTSSQTFVNVLTTPTTLTLNQFSTVTVISNGANWLRTTNL